MRLEVSKVEFNPIFGDGGLRGFCAFVVDNQFQFRGVGVYTNRNPQSRFGYRLVFPTRKLRNGTSINLFNPIGDEVRSQIETQVLPKIIELFQDLRDERV